MKRTGFLFLIFSLLLLQSCGNDDDICTSGEATARLKMKFKTLSTGKERTLDTLYVAVDYGDGPKDLTKLVAADSVLVPLRVDEQPFTEIYLKTRSAGPVSQIKIDYTIKSQYVSPACGLKRLYEDVTYTLEKSSPVQKLETNQSQITNESKTHLYLLF